jgi:hypothetical protein
MPISLNHYGAGLKNGTVKIADGNTYDIAAIVTAEGDPQVDDIQVSGDDEVKASFFYNRREEITLAANGLSFDVIQAITGNTVSSSAGGLDVALGTDSENNPPFVEIKADTTAKDDDGTNVTIYKTWHKVQINSIKVSQSQGSEFSLEMTGTAYQTDEDIEGNALGSKRITTLEVSY